MSKARALLGVNIDHVATIRQARRTAYPDLRLAAQAAVAGGADGITIHLREDRRHIQDADVYALAATLTVPLNLELAATDEMVAIACGCRPEKCCFVPERRQELTTEGGLDVATLYDRLGPRVERLARAGIAVSLFIDGDDVQIDAAARLAVPAIELHTGRYAEAGDPERQARELAALAGAAQRARAAGLLVNAGHGLHYANVAAVAALPEIHELNIGHAIVAEALFVGMERATAGMTRLLVEARR